MKLTSLTMTFRRLVCLVALVVMAIGSSANAEMGKHVNRLGRYWGIGYSDGYHACKTRTSPPGANLPIARPSPSVAARWNALKPTRHSASIHTPIVTVPNTPLWRPRSAESSCD